MLLLQRPPLQKVFFKPFGGVCYGKPQPDVNQNVLNVSRSNPIAVKPKEDPKKNNSEPLVVPLIRQQATQKCRPAPGHRSEAVDGVPSKGKGLNKEKKDFSFGVLQKPTLDINLELSVSDLEDPYVARILDQVPHIAHNTTVTKHGLGSEVADFFHGTGSNGPNSIDLVFLKETMEPQVEFHLGPPR